jgi:sugar/nucleoside kinase (ribokinase family)
MTPITVLGNLSVDHVDDGPPSPGGCPSFSGVALAASGGAGRVIARGADGDRPIFSDLLDNFPVAISVLAGEVTSAFSLRYPTDYDERSLTVDAIGDPWQPADIEAADIDSRWVHVSPLLRSDFPPETLRALAASGRHLSYDGQGLVRIPAVGELRMDAAYDPAILDSVRVLKLAEEEAHIVAGGPFDAAAAERVGVPEILVTFGAGGCDLYIGGRVQHIPAVGPVGGVHTTGAGDIFTVAYVAGRAKGAPPEEAAHRASELVARMLQARREEMRGKVNGGSAGLD